MHYYLTVNGQSVGPMTKEQIFSYPVDANTPVSKDGGAWQPLFSYPELMQMLSIYQRTPSQTSADSKKTLCGIMAILFGTLGIQYFLVGKVGGGFITIGLSIVTCGLWGILTLIQGIMMLTMSDEDFERKYVLSSSTFPLF